MVGQHHFNAGKILHDYGNVRHAESANIDHLFSLLLNLIRIILINNAKKGRLFKMAKTKVNNLLQTD